MKSPFLEILNGERPGHVILETENVFALLAPTPIRMGHALVVPRALIDHWIDLPPSLLNEVAGVMKTVGCAIQTAMRPEKVGVLVGGLVVRHAHFHLIPIDSLDDLDLKRQQQTPDPQRMLETAEIIREALKSRTACNDGGYNESDPS